VLRAGIGVFFTALSCIAFVAGPSTTLRGSQQQSQPADLVVVNGKVVTLDSGSTVVQATAVRGGKFVAVGSNEEVRRLAGPQTRLIDARGRTVIPGIIDTHVHATGVASGEAAQPYKNLTSIAAVQEWVRAETKRVPEGQWIWPPRMYPTRLKERRFPKKEELDIAAPNHPVAIDGAYALVLNSAALRAANITAQTPDPPGGAIVKDAQGQPTGLLRNVGGMLSKFRPREVQGIPLDMLERVHRAYNAIGITSVIERGSSVEGYRAYEALKNKDRLHVRSTITIRLPGGRDADYAGFIKNLPVKFAQGDDMLKVGPLKIVVDGGILIGTAYMREPYGPQSKTLYSVEDPAYRGFLTLPPERIKEAAKVVHSAGWQLVAHVTGDAGVDHVLDAIEAAQANDTGTGRRHTIIHGYFVNPESARRAAKLGVLVDTQPAWYYKDGDALATGLGKARLEHFIGLRTLSDAGVRTSINTDHMFGLDPDTALNPFNPFLTIYTAVTRKTEGADVIGGGEAISREQALRMMTADAAYLSFDETNRGSIEVGKLGDLVILSDDFLTCPPERIRQIRPEATILGGKVVYEKE
jgi:predicted amidohydrolase YtcJ